MLHFRIFSYTFNKQRKKEERERGIGKDGGERGRKEREGEEERGRKGVIDC